MTLPLRQILQDTVKQVPEVLPYLSGNARKFINSALARKAEDYPSIYDRFFDAIYNAVSGFLNSNAHMGTYSRLASAALSQAYIETADVAYQEGGGSLPLDEDTASLARSMLGLQFGYIDALFMTLKAMRKEGDFDADAEATARAEGYSHSLDMFFNTIKVAGAGNKMLTFAGSDGKESCKDCKRYKGKRHRAKWWVANDAVPPNHNFECGGFHCEHFLVDDDGNEFTI